MDTSMEIDLELETVLADEPLTSFEEDVKPEETVDSSKVKLVGDEEVDRFEALPRPTAIFLHGVDDMSTKDITSYCNQESLIKVEWINDASCNLAFKTEEEARVALDSLILKKEEAIINHKELLPAKPFVDSDGKTHTLFVRISTDEDVKERGARQRSRYYQIHGTENETISKERQTARKEYYERQGKSGGDGRSVFSRLGNRVEGNDRRRRSLSPSRRDTERSTRRDRRSPEREIPSHLLSRLGPIKTSAAEEEKEDIKQDDDSIKVESDTNNQ